MTLDRVAVLLIFELAIGGVDSDYRVHHITTNVRDLPRTSLRYIISQLDGQRNPINPIKDPGIGVRDEHYRWPRVGNKIVVPFTLDPAARFTRLQISKIYAAMRHISDRTCVSFKVRTAERDHLLIYSGRWCTSYVGRVGGQQALSLERGATCANHMGTIIHELVHALGFVHMQSHANRDQYIAVISENISAGEVHQFRKIAAWEATNFGTPYDYHSIMHYGTHAFSRNGGPTILTRGGKYNKIIGQNIKLSAGDVTRIRNMYRCECVEKGLRDC